MIAHQDDMAGTSDGPLACDWIGAILALADKQPDAPAIRFKSLGLWHAMTRRSLADAVLSLAHNLGGHIGPGESACLVAGPSSDALIASLALQLAGARPVLCDPADSPDRIAAATSGARLLLIDHPDVPIPSVAPTVILLRGDPARVNAGGAVIAVDQLRREGGAGSVRARATVRMPPRSWGIISGDDRICFASLAEPGELCAQYHVLAVGGVLDFVERRDTVAEDMHALQPAVCDAPAAFWTAMHCQVETAADAATGFQRRCYRTALAMNGRDRSIGASAVGARIARLLVLDRLRRRLGIAHLRRATVSEGDITEPVLAWFRTLGVDLRRFPSLSDTKRGSP